MSLWAWAACFEKKTDGSVGWGVDGEGREGPPSSPSLPPALPTLSTSASLLPASPPACPVLCTAKAACVPRHTPGEPHTQPPHSRAHSPERPPDTGLRIGEPDVLPLALPVPQAVVVGVGLDRGLEGLEARGHAGDGGRAVGRAGRPAPVRAGRGAGGRRRGSQLAWVCNAVLRGPPAGDCTGRPYQALSGPWSGAGWWDAVREKRSGRAQW